MHLIPVSKLKNYNYSIDVINALKQYWKKSSSFNCIGRPKKKNMLLYLDGCCAEYTLKSGKKITAESGSVVYAPVNCEYSVRFYDFKKPSSNTVGINLFIYGSDGEPIILGDDIEIYSADNENYKMLFSKANIAGELITPNYGKMKAAVYDILSALGDYYMPEAFGKYNIIAPGIIAIEKGDVKDLYIGSLAEMCGISECYFRRLFKEYSGMSPTEYIIHSKIQRAKTLLKYNNISAAETAELLGFGDPSYFTKKFKEYTKMTPIEYRNKQ